MIYFHAVVLSFLNGFLPCKLFPSLECKVTYKDVEGRFFVVQTLRIVGGDIYREPSKLGG